MLFSFTELQRSEINIRDYNQNEIDQIKLPNYDDRPSMQVRTYRTRVNTARTTIEPAPQKNMLTFSFYIIFKLKFHQKKLNFFP